MFVAPGGGIFGPGRPGPTPSSKTTAVSHHPAPVFAAGAVSPECAALLDTLPYGFVLLGTKQEVRHENALCRQLTGHGLVECGGVESWLSALCPEAEHREKVIQSWREDIWRNQLTRTFTLRTAAQKPREIEFRSSLLPDGGMTLSLEDVTETRRAEETQRNGRWKFRALFSHTRTATVLVDRSGRIIDANPAFLRLSGIGMKDLRLSPFPDLLHPAEASALAAAEQGLFGRSDGGSRPRQSEDRTLTREIWLRTRTGERRTLLTSCPVGEPGAAPALSLYLFDDPEAESANERLKTRLRAVAKKAQALLNAVPDLILLVERDGTIADFAPPPAPWKELKPDDTWRKRPLSEVWPVLGNVFSQCLGQILERSRTIQAEIRGPGADSYEFSVTLSSGGDDQILAVVRNLSGVRELRERDLWQQAAFAHAPLPILKLDSRGRIDAANEAAAALLETDSASACGSGFSSADLPGGLVAEFLALEEQGSPRGSLVFVKDAPGLPSPATLHRSQVATSPGEPSLQERRQHSLRNQLQLVTSLFSLEPQSAAAREAFIKWQVRLRSLALACPYDLSNTLWVFPLLRGIADEICSLVGRGPGRREVIVTGDENLTVDAQTATPLSLLAGELMRLILATRQPGPGPELYVNALPHPAGGFSLSIRPGAQRTFVFTDRDSEIETLEILTEQLQGRLEPVDPANPTREWILIVPGNGRP